MRTFIALPVIVAPLLFPLQGIELSEHLEAFRAVGPEGKGNVEAGAAWSEVVQLSAESIDPILTAMEGASPLAMNWMRTAAETILS